MTVHNKFTNSYNKEKYQNFKNRHPLEYIGELINAYHSVEHRPWTDEQKKTMKNQIVEEIKQVTNRTNPKLKSDIRLSLKDKEYWNQFRNRIMS